MPSQPHHHQGSFIGRIWRGFWSIIGTLRNIVLNGIFLIFLFVIIASIVESTPKPLPTDAPLHIAPQGVLVDQLSYNASGLELLTQDTSMVSETLTRELVKTIEVAAIDSNVTALLLQLDYFQGGGLSKIAEVGQAIDNFKSSGKPVIAYADYYSQQQYFLASYADEIHLNDMGRVFLTGYGMYRNYYKKAIDKLDVNVHIFRVGDFKDFVEPYVREDMSDASREHNSEWINAMWEHYTDHVERRRKLAPGTINDMINHIDNHLDQNDRSGAQLALNLNLVDYVSSRIERNEGFLDRFGGTLEDKNQVKAITYRDYLWHQQNTEIIQTGNIGLIAAVGNIWDGSQPEGAIGGDSLSRLIRKARHDDEVKALVIRVDSGGGSAFASELIRQEINATRKAGKPVFISMGSVAASGGYWLATGADQIWATPTTITGSIGVFGIFPTFEEPLDKIGVSTDGFGTTDMASGLRPDLPMNPLVHKMLQTNVEHTYDRFLDIVAEAREQSTEDIHAIAQGRVWMGSKAKELDLVDNLGTLNQVVAAVADFANLPHYSVKVIERDLSPQEKLLKVLSENAHSLAATIGLDLLGFSTNDIETLKTLSTLQSDAHLGSAILKIADFDKRVKDHIKLLSPENSGKAVTQCLACYPY